MEKIKVDNGVLCGCAVPNGIIGSGYVRWGGINTGWVSPVLSTRAAMRGLTTVTLALAGLAAHAIAHTAPPPLPQRRKSLGFGPLLPHARFETPLAAAGFAPVSSTDPFHVARDFLSQYVDPAVGRAYTIRSDSYTDRTTGVTHIYARQLIGGIEVADGHINLNIKDGRILSFGDSVGRTVS